MFIITPLKSIPFLYIVSRFDSKCVCHGQITKYRQRFKSYKYLLCWVDCIIHKDISTFLSFEKKRIKNRKN